MEGGIVMCLTGLLQLYYIRINFIIKMLYKTVVQIQVSGNCFQKNRIYFPSMPTYYHAKETRKT